MNKIGIKSFNKACRVPCALCLRSTNKHINKIELNK